MKINITHDGESLAAVIMGEDWSGNVKLKNSVYVYIHTYQMIYIFVFIG